jgi:hypothetical protein
MTERLYNMNEKYEVNKELVLSTSHISSDTAGVLTTHLHVGLADLLINSTEYGWRFVAHVDECVLVKLPVELSALLRLATSLGCTYLLLDQDGPIMENLQKFDW